MKSCHLMLTSFKSPDNSRVMNGGKLVWRCTLQLICVWMTLFKVLVVQWHDRNGDWSDVVMRLCVVMKSSFISPAMDEIWSYRCGGYFYPNNLYRSVMPILSSEAIVIPEPSTVFLLDDSWCITGTSCGYRLDNITSLLMPSVFLSAKMTLLLRQLDHSSNVTLLEIVGRTHFGT
jgi:hypothetical protein